MSSMDWENAIRQKAQGSTDAAFWNAVSDELAALKAGQDDPVAFIHRTKQHDHLSFFNNLSAISANETYLETVPLYTSAPTIPEGEPTYGQLKIRLEQARETIEAQRLLLLNRPTIPAGYVLLSRSQHAEVVECLHDMATGKGGWSWEEVYQEHRAILDAAPKGETA